MACLTPVALEEYLFNEPPSGASASANALRVSVRVASPIGEGEDAKDTKEEEKEDR